VSNLARVRRSAISWHKADVPPLTLNVVRRDGEQISARLAKHPLGFIAQAFDRLIASLVDGARDESHAQFATQPPDNPALLPSRFLARDHKTELIGQIGIGDKKPCAALGYIRDRAFARERSVFCLNPRDTVDWKTLVLTSFGKHGRIPMIKKVG
jgi:hypothetical protein